MSLEEYVVLIYFAFFIFVMNKLWWKYLKEERIALAAYYRVAHGILWFMGLILATQMFMIWKFYICLNTAWIKNNLLMRIKDPKDNGIVVGLRIGILIQLIFHGLLLSPEAIEFLMEKLVGI